MYQSSYNRLPLYLYITSAVSATSPFSLFFFFQAEDGIRDLTVTGVQTCALPISRKKQAKFERTSLNSTSQAGYVRTHSRSRERRSASATFSAAASSRVRPGGS